MRSFENNNPIIQLFCINRNASGPVRGRPTNNVAEIEAVTHAVDIAGKNGVRGDLQVRTDSRFVVDSHDKYMPRWKQNGWRFIDGGPVKNTEQFQALDSAIRNNPQLNVQLKHVRGHAGDRYNIEADRLARNGAAKYRQSHYGHQITRKEISNEI